MKTLNGLLMVTTIAASLTLANQASAHDALLSPRAMENEIKTVSGTTSDLLDRSVKAGSPKGLELTASLRIVPGTATDLIDRSYAGIPKLREQLGTRATEIQVAPLK